ncbi:hypothetical protein OROMI_006727 [Orobanche minor]
MREQKRATILEKKKALSGPSSSPRVIVLFGLSACVNLNAVEEDILSLLSEEGNTTAFPVVASSKYKLRTTVLKAPQGDIVACMEMAKVADLLAFVASPNSLREADDTYSFIDSFGSQCLSVFKTLGLPSTVVLIRALDRRSGNRGRKEDNMPLDDDAPLLCAGITSYSPMRYFGLDEPGQHIGVVGFGGLGRVAIKFAKAHNITADIEVIAADYVNTALERLAKAEV